MTTPEEPQQGQEKQEKEKNDELDLDLEAVQDLDVNADAAGKIRGGDCNGSSFDDC